MAAIVRTVDFEAPIEMAFETICDFESYTEFLEGMREVKIHDRHNNHAVVEFTLDLFKRFTYTLDLDMEGPDEVKWKLVEADMMKKNDGSWKLKQSGGITNAEYTIDIDFNIWVPGPIKDFLINSSIPSTLQSFKKEIEKRAASSAKKTNTRKNK